MAKTTPTKQATWDIDGAVIHHLDEPMSDAATIPTYRHEPKVHVNYQETVLPIRDGLPKMRDLPKEMGGSGETLAE